MSAYEIVMLICFGMAWPLSISKMLRNKRSDGKCVWFLCVLMLGYLSGIMHKAINSFDGVIWLYVLNFCMVGIDLYLVLYYRRKNIERTILTEKVNG